MTSVALFCIVFIIMSIKEPTNGVNAESSTNKFQQTSLSSCPDKCLSCNQTFCFACKIGYKGDNCDHLCSNCRPSTECDKTSGYCFNMCRDGLSGENCNETCDSKCMSCDRLLKNKCFICAHDRYGILCNSICSKGCLRNTCHGKDNVCKLGCTAEYEGLNCNQKDNICDNATGACLNGCEEGYNGMYCTASANHNDVDGHFTLTTLNIGLVFGLGLGLIAIVTLITIVICIKRIQSRQGTSDDDQYDVIRTSNRMKFSGMPRTFNKKEGR